MELVYMIEFTSQDFWVTVFMQAETVDPSGWQWFYVDDAFLHPAEPTPTSSPSATPTITPLRSPGSWRVY